MYTVTEENYLKAIAYLTYLIGQTGVGTNDLAAHLNVKPATVTDMLKKLKEREAVDYKKYGKISLTDSGKIIANLLIRKHRLWETFMYEKLGFGWDEVHEVAEQLEHINSTKLTDSLEEFLGFPRVDPHGDVIPDRNGVIIHPFSRLLSDVEPESICKVIAVKDNSNDFLQYAEKVGIQLGKIFKLDSREKFDRSVTIRIDEEVKLLSDKFAGNIFVVVEGDEGF